MWQYNYTNELTHYGILGMKWGVRRYQNKDGTLTSAGKKRYDRVSTLQKRAEEIKKKKGTTNDAYISARKKWYAAKNKQRLRDARAAKDRAEIIRAKENLSFAKRTRKKGGLAYYLPSVQQEVLGRLSADEKTIINDIESRHARRRATTTKFLKIAGPIAISTLSTAVATKGEHYVQNRIEAGWASLKFRR